MHTWKQCLLDQSSVHAFHQCIHNIPGGAVDWLANYGPVCHTHGYFKLFKYAECSAFVLSENTFFTCADHYCYTPSLQQVPLAPTLGGFGTSRGHGGRLFCESISRGRRLRSKSLNRASENGLHKELSSTAKHAHYLTAFNGMQTLHSTRSHIERYT